MGIIGAFAVPHPPLIVPAVGKGAEDGISKTVEAYRRIAREIAISQPDTIVLLSSHAPAYRDGFYVSKGGTAVASMAAFGAPHEHFEVHYDEQLSAGICRTAEPLDVPTCGYDPNGRELDHASFIPLWFVREALRENGNDHESEYEASGDLPPIVRIGLSWLPPERHRTLGRAIADAIDTSGKRVAIVASGDLSHRLLAEGPYGFREEGPVFDAQVTDVFARGALDELFDIDEALAEGAGECGLRPFIIMAGTVEKLELKPQLLSYEGPYGVGYAVASFSPETEQNARAAQEPDDAADPFVALARESVEHFVKTSTPLPRPDNLPSELTDKRAGAFVSLHAYGDLRGCIGTISACTSCLADEIIANGVSAASQDPRFPAVRPEELDFLSYSVDVLGEAEPISSEKSLDPKRYGVIVTKGFRRGLLLPNLDGIDTVERQLAIARAKAGIDDWERGVKLERFEVVRHNAGGEARNER